QSAQEMLEELGYTVILARDGNEAVRIFIEQANIDVAVLDVVMPGLSGPDAYSQMVNVRGDFAVIFTTGYATEAAHLTSISETRAPVLQKPYDATSLTQTIGAALGRTLGVKPQ